MARRDFSRRERMERRVLLGPEFLRRAAANRLSVPEERWMLVQPRAVRESFVHEVFDRAGDPDLLRQVWMMRQPGAVRERFVREVLEPALGGAEQHGDTA